MGESPLSDAVEVTVDEEDEVAHFEWSNIPTGLSGTTARHLYRTRADGDVFYLVGARGQHGDVQRHYARRGLETPFNAALTPITRCRFW